MSFFWLQKLRSFPQRLIWDSEPTLRDGTKQTFTLTTQDPGPRGAQMH